MLPLHTFIKKKFALSWFIKRQRICPKASAVLDESLNCIYGSIHAVW